jgi:hypothetical protein
MTVSWNSVKGLRKSMKIFRQVMRSPLEIEPNTYDIQAAALIRVVVAHRPIREMIHIL